MNLINYDDGSSTPITSAAATQNGEEEEPVTSEDSDQAEIDKLEAEILENIQKESTVLPYDDDVFNLLLIGSDGRTSSSSSRSDAMILISINKHTKKIVMTSLMRDIYVSIPGYKNNRLNAAFAYGGTKLLLTTIRNNFQIPVDKYVWVDFFDFIDIIDMMGGVNLDVTAEECASMNGYIHEINELLGIDPQHEKLDEGGSNMHLSGKQALAYTRVRYVGNSDFGRTERQRIVLSQLFEKLKGQNIAELYEVLNKLLPDVTTNLTKGELFSLLLSAPIYKNYSFVEYRVPIDGSYKGLTIEGKSVLGIDFDKNIEELKKIIYQ